MPSKVYYLDDEQDLVDIFSEIFSTVDRIVKPFSDPKLFLSAVQNDPPDLIFLDYRLPGLTGDQVAKEISPAIPKVLITGEMDVQPEVEYIAIIRKPFKIEEIESLMSQVLRRKSR